MSLFNTDPSGKADGWLENQALWGESLLLDLAVLTKASTMEPWPS